MAKNTKNLITLIVAILAVLSLILVFNISSELNKLKSKFNKEVSFKFDMEQKVDALSNEKLDLIETTKSKDLEIQKLTKDLEAANQGSSEQEKRISDLTKQLEEITSQKQTLENSINESSVKQLK